MKPLQTARRSRVKLGFTLYSVCLLTVFAVLSFFIGDFAPVLLQGPLQSLEGLKHWFGDKQSPGWPLFTAFMMVGLAPTIPGLTHVERKFRQWAHDVAEIPWNFVEAAHALLQVEVDEGPWERDLVNTSDAKDRERVLKRAREVLSGTEYDRLANRTAKLFAFRSWARTADMWPEPKTRAKFARVLQEVEKPTQAVISELVNQATLMPVAEDEAQAAAALQVWASMSERVEDATGDVCALFALYAENANTLPEHDNAISNLLRDLIIAGRLKRGMQVRPVSEDRLQAEPETSRSADPDDKAIMPEIAAIKKDVYLARRNALSIGAVLQGLATLAIVAFAIGYIGAFANILSFNEDPFPIARSFVLGAAILYGPPTYLAARAFSAPALATGTHRPSRVSGSRYLPLFLKSLTVSVCALSIFVFSDMAAAHLRNVGGIENAEPLKVVSRFLGLDQWLGIVPLQTCETGKVETSTSAGYAMAFAFLGAAHAVMVKFMAQTVAREPDRLAGRWIIPLHGGVLAGVCLLANIALQRTVPCVFGTSELMQTLGLNLNLAEELVAYEVLAAFLLGVTFAFFVRRASVSHRVGKTATR